MHPDDLLSVLNAVPFQPFRIVANGGMTSDVRHPEVVAVGRSSWRYYYVPTPPGLTERFDILSFFAINRIEVSIPVPTSSNGG